MFIRNSSSIWFLQLPVISSVPLKTLGWSFLMNEFGDTFDMYMFSYASSASLSTYMFINCIDVGILLFPSASLFLSTCDSTCVIFILPFQCLFSTCKVVQISLSRCLCHDDLCSLSHIANVSITDFESICHSTFPFHLISVRKYVNTDRRPNASIL